MKKVIWCVIAIFVLALHLPIAVLATEATPMYNCLGGEPCTTPEPSVPPTSGSTYNISNQPTPDPCLDEEEDEDEYNEDYYDEDDEDDDNDDASIQTTDEHRWGHKHHHKSGNGFIEQLLRLLIELIQKLLGGQNIEIPNLDDNNGDNNNDDDENGNDNDEDNSGDDENNGDDNGNNNEDDPCEDNEDEEDDEDEENSSPTTNPSTGAPQNPTVPANTTPGTSSAPAPSTIVIMPSGGGTVAGCAQADIQNLVNSISEANIKANLEKLVQDDAQPLPNELGSRYVSNPGNAAKVQWAQQQLASYGLSAELQPFSASGENVNNVVGTINGTNANSFYAVGGHIDSINDDDESGPAPGADDDGSAIAIALEVARVIKGLPQQCFKSGVQFVGFNDEENSMGGSETYVQSVSGKEFKGLFNMDMVGGKGSSDCISNLYNSSKDQFMATKLTEVNTKYNVGLTLEDGTYSSSDIDSISFWDAGLPSSYQVECGDSPGYHTADDTTKYISYTQMTKLAKVLVAAVAELVNQ